MLNLNDLRLFAHVVDNGGYTAAARVVGIAKQTLSKRVAELERQAGQRLVQRSSRSFKVTEAGEDLYQHARHILIEAESAEATLQGRLAEPSGQVRITASVPTAQLFLAPLLPRIAAALPKVRIALEASDRFVDIVREGFDLALRDHTGSLPDSELVTRFLRYEDFWLVASPAFLAHSREPDTPEALSGHKRVASELDALDWNLTNQAGGTTPAGRMETVFVANESMVLLEAALADLGVARLPSSICRDAIGQRKLHRILPDWSAGRITTSLLMPSRRGQLPSVRAVADLLVEFFAGKTRGQQ